MDSLTPASTVHYYDTRLHRILCGVQGFDHRSTKHSRSVTCHACVALLGERPTATPAHSFGAASDAAP